MTVADVRWLQRLENYERALATLERALTLAASRPLSKLPKVEGRLAFDSSTTSNADLFDLLEP